MNRVWQIAVKELTQTRRDRLAALFTLVIPVVFTIFLGVIIGGMGDSDRLPLGVVDDDATPASRLLLDGLSASPLLELKSMTTAKIDTAVENQSVAAGLVIPKGFSTALEHSEPVTLPFIRLETSSGAQSVLEAVQEVISRTNVIFLASKTAAEEVAAETGRPTEGSISSAAASLVRTALATPVLTVQPVESAPGGQNKATAAVENASGFEISSTGSLVNWVLFSLLSVTTGVAWERRRGLLRRLTTTGASGSSIVGGKMLAMVIITLLQQALLILIGQLAFGVHYFHSPAALVLTMVSLSILAASTGLLISSLFRSEQAVVAATVITAQLLAVLGGAWFPLEVTSASFSRAAHFFPSAWVMDSLHGIVLNGWGISEVAGALGFVWIWIAALLGFAVWRFSPQ